MNPAFKLLAVSVAVSIGSFPTQIGFPSRIENQKIELISSASPLSQQEVQKIAVTEKGWDDIGLILDSLGLAYESIQNSDLPNYELIKEYDVIFINCSVLAVDYADASIESLEQFVREGGKLYASDYAYIYIELAFPGFIKFYDISPGGSGSGLGETTVTADILDPGLQEELTSQTVDIYFDLPDWVVIDSVSDSVHIYLSGDFPIFTGGPLTDKPLSVSFPYEEGYVLYTSYHNEVGSVEVTEEQNTLLQYLVLATTKPIALPEGGAAAAPEGEAASNPMGDIPVWVIAGSCCLGLLFILAVGAGFFIFNKRRTLNARNPTETPASITSS